MKALILIVFIFSLQTMANENAPYFERPLSCPLRFSQLSTLRDQIQTLSAGLGKDCTQTGQQAISQLTSNVANLETITNSFNNYSTATNALTNAQYAKNVGQIIGSLNTITSNNACFYDIRSRGLLPVLSDVVMSVSQLGLLVTSAPGALFASAGYIAGSSIKIIDGLFKNKFNFSKPEDRKAFIQLNCAFFDTRKIMEEVGIFNPATEDFREQIITSLKQERINLLKLQKSKVSKSSELEELLMNSMYNIPEACQAGLDPFLLKKLDDVSKSLTTKAPDFSEKLRQVAILSERATDIINGLKNLKLDKKTDIASERLTYHMNKILPELKRDGKLWVGTIDEFELLARGPIMAFINPIQEAMRKELSFIEAEIAVNTPDTYKKITILKNDIQSIEKSSWAINLRLSSLKARIENLERPVSSSLFSNSDEGSSNAVDILDYYRKLQNSILGPEGKNYLKNVIRTSKEMREGLKNQIDLLKEANSLKEKCSAAEKTRLAWTQYRFRAEEGYDFVATNVDLFRSNFKIGKEKLNSSTRFVLTEIESVEDLKRGLVPEQRMLAYYMRDITNRVKEVEKLLKESACF